jgi:hypothetical protein
MRGQSEKKSAISLENGQLLQIVLIAYAPADDCAGIRAGLAGSEGWRRAEAEAEVEADYVDAGPLASRLRRNVSRLFSLK